MRIWAAILTASVCCAQPAFRATRPRTVNPTRMALIQAGVTGGAAWWTTMETRALMFAGLTLEPTFHITNITNSATPVLTISPAMGFSSGTFNWVCIGGLTGNWAHLNQADTIAGNYSLGGSSPGCMAGTIQDSTHLVPSSFPDTTAYGSFSGQAAVIFDQKGTINFNSSSYLGGGYQNGYWLEAVEALAKAYYFESDAGKKASMGAQLVALIDWFVAFQDDYAISVSTADGGYSQRNHGMMLYLAAAFAYPAFSSSELTRMAKALAMQSDSLQAVLQGGWSYATADNSDAGAQNYYLGFLDGFLLGSIELYGEDASMPTLYTLAAQQFAWSIPPTVNPPSSTGAAGIVQGADWTGLPSEGVCYGRTDVDYQVALIAVSYADALTDNSVDLQALGLNDWFKRKIYQEIYARRPDNWGEDQTGEMSATNCGPSRPLDLQIPQYVLGEASTEGRFARWFYRHYGPYPSGTITAGSSTDPYTSQIDPFFDFASWTATTYGSLAPYRWDGENEIIWRSGWGTSDVMAKLFTGRRFLPSGHAADMLGQFTLWRGLDGVLPGMNVWNPQYNIKDNPGPNNPTAQELSITGVTAASNTLVFTSTDQPGEQGYHPLQQFTPSLGPNHMFASVNYTDSWGYAGTGSPLQWWNRSVAATGTTGGSATAIVVDRTRLVSATGRLVRDGHGSDRGYVQVQSDGTVLLSTGFQTGGGTSVLCDLANTPAPDVMTVSGAAAGLNGTYHCASLQGSAPNGNPVYLAAETVSPALVGVYCSTSWGAFGGYPTCGHQGSGFALSQYARPRVRWLLNTATPNTRASVVSNTATNQVGSSKVWVTNLTGSATMALTQSVWSNNVFSASNQPGQQVEADVIETSDTSQNGGLDLNLVHVVYADSSSGSDPASTLLLNTSADLVVQAGSVVARFSPQMVTDSTGLGGGYKVQTATTTTFTSTFSGTGRYLIGHMAPGTYAVTLGGVAVTGSPFTVGSDGAFSFSATAGSIVVGAGAGPSGSLLQGNFSLTGRFSAH